MISQETWNEVREDLKAALKEGWLYLSEYGADLCVYCGEDAIYSNQTQSYICNHPSDCLMVKYAYLLSEDKK